MVNHIEISIILIVASEINTIMRTNKLFNDTEEITFGNAINQRRFGHALNRTKHHAMINLQ